MSQGGPRSRSGSFGKKRKISCACRDSIRKPSRLHPNHYIDYATLPWPPQMYLYHARIFNPVPIRAITRYQCIILVQCVSLYYVHGESDFSRKHTTLIRCDIRKSEHYQIFMTQINHVVWMVKALAHLFSPVCPPQCRS
jgi:hypothetical protein